MWNCCWEGGQEAGKDTLVLQPWDTKCLSTMLKQEQHRLAAVQSHHLHASGAQSHQEENGLGLERNSQAPGTAYSCTDATR